MDKHAASEEEPSPSFSLVQVTRGRYYGGAGSRGSTLGDMKQPCRKTGVDSRKTRGKGGAYSVPLYRNVLGMSCAELLFPVEVSIMCIFFAAAAVPLRAPRIAPPPRKFYWPIPLLWVGARYYRLLPAGGGAECQ